MNMVFYYHRCQGVCCELSRSPSLRKARHELTLQHHLFMAGCPYVFDTISRRHVLSESLRSTTNRWGDCKLDGELSNSGVPTLFILARPCIAFQVYFFSGRRNDWVKDKPFAPIRGNHTQNKPFHGRTQPPDQPTLFLDICRHSPRERGGDSANFMYIRTYARWA